MTEITAVASTGADIPAPLDAAASPSSPPPRKFESSLQVYLITNKPLARECACGGDQHFANQPHWKIPPTDILLDANAAEDATWYVVTRGRHVGVYSNLYVFWPW